MSAKHSPTKLKIYGLGAMSLGLTSLLSLFLTAQAQTPLQLTPSQKIVPIVNFEPPNDEAVDNSRGGASRSPGLQCWQSSDSPSAIVPLLPSSQTGLTVSDRPTFWVYLPPSNSATAHFTLKDRENRGIYQTALQIPQGGGLLGIQLPPTSEPLAFNTTYHWSVAVLCPTVQTDIPVAGGTIRRVEASINSKESSTAAADLLLQQAATYGRAGIWYDALNNLAQLRQNQPQDRAVRVNWYNLLESVGLGEIASAPFLQ